MRRQRRGFGDISSWGAPFPGLQHRGLNASIQSADSSMVGANFRVRRRRDIQRLGSASQGFCRLLDDFGADDFDPTTWISTTALIVACCTSLTE